MAAMGASQTKTRWILARVGDVVVIFALLASWLLIILDISTGRRPAGFLNLLMLFVCPILLFRIVPRTIEGWKTNRTA